VWNRTDNALPPILSHIAYAGLRAAALVLVPHLDRISPREAVRGIPGDVPVLIMAGGTDRLARADEARAIFREVESHGKLVFFPRAGHGNLLNADRDLYERTVFDFCREIENRSRSTVNAGG
jgi:alpha-beta hydrolase superfamily lysophospholipase